MTENGFNMINEDQNGFGTDDLNNNSTSYDTVFSQTNVDTIVHYAFYNISGLRNLGSTSVGDIYTVDNTSGDSNNSNSTDTVYPLVKQPVHMIVLFSTMFGLVFLCSILGNLSVLCVVVRDRRFHSATYYLIANLAAADLIVAVVCQPITLLTNLFTGWRYGAFMCKAAPYLQGVAVCASVNTLVVIAGDRYIAICHVMRRRHTKRMAKIILFVIWILALSLMTPWALFFKISQWSNSVQVIDLCVEDFPSTEHMQAFFLGVIFLMCYALPLAFIMACYFMIGYRVWNRDAPGITSSRGVIEKSKVRVIKMLAVVVVLFMFSWMPLYILKLKLLFSPPPEGSDLAHFIHAIAFPFAQWLGTSNSCMNPLVYCLFSQKIRGRIRAMLCCAKPEMRSLYSCRFMYNSALQHSNSTRDSTIKVDTNLNGHNNCSTYGHHYGGGNLYHHRPSTRNDAEFIRLQRNNNVRSTHV